jgi:hypothetical protein
MANIGFVLEEGAKPADEIESTLANGREDKSVDLPRPF